MTSITEITPNNSYTPVSRGGTTIDKVLFALCDANAILIKNSNAIQERLRTWLETVITLNADMQERFKYDGGITIALGVVTGLTGIGLAASGFNDYIKPADVIGDTASKTNSLFFKSKEDSLEARRRNAERLGINGAQEIDQYAHNQIKAQENIASKVLEAHYKS